MADEQPDEPSTVDAPVRWSGAAPVPDPPGAKLSWWARRRAEDDLPPAVDPWEGQDTPWDPMPLPPEPLPPTRVEPPSAPPPERARRTETPPPAPVQWRPPAGPYPPRMPERPLPPPPRRRRRWPRRLALVTVLGTLCCCGLPAYFSWPAARQHPVSAVLPASVSDLDRRDDAASRRAAQRLSQELSGGKAFAGIYSDGNGKRVTIFGTTGFRLTPRQDLEAQIQRLAEKYDISTITAYDLGETGLHERCGPGRAGGSSVVVCAWADHGSLATVLMTRRSVDDSAELTGVLRSAVLIHG